MKLRIQSNAWSCLSTSAAMVLDVNQYDVEAAIGHDGSEIIFPDLDEPFCRRGHHVQEITDLFMAQFHWPVWVERVIVTADPCGNDVRWEDDERFFAYVERFKGILFGNGPDTMNGHAVAWDGSVCYDPRGQKYDLSAFKADAFLAVL